MRKPNLIELNDGVVIPILYQDRSVLAIDKPAGWMLAPYNWDKTSRNLPLAITSSILAGDFWARSRSLKYLRHVHRLDADTTGVLLMAKSPGALHSYGRLFESRQIEKKYLAVVLGVPKEKDWTSRLRISSDPKQIGRMKIDARHGKDAETHFHVLQTLDRAALIEARPVTGRTHQIRLHLSACGFPIVGDLLYANPSASLDGSRKPSGNFPLALRAVALDYFDPFQRRRVHIGAPVDEFCRAFGFSSSPAL